MIYDTIPFPIFIIGETDVKREKSYLVHYKNKQAEDLQEKIKKTVGTKKIKKDCYFYDLIDPKFHNLFDIEVERCLNPESGITYFDFPLMHMNELNTDNGFDTIGCEMSENGPTFFKGEVNKVKFYRITATHCNWKYQDSIMVT